MVVVVVAGEADQKRTSFFGEGGAGGQLDDGSPTTIGSSIVGAMYGRIPRRPLCIGGQECTGIHSTRYSSRRFVDSTLTSFLVERRMASSRMVKRYDPTVFNCSDKHRTDLGQWV